jgi:hypothetical protein
MRQKILSIVIIILFFITVLSASMAISIPNTKLSQTTSQEGWYYLPGYPNYSPAGLPDFDQKQDNWKARQGIWRFVGGLWSFCGPTSLADIFWWFDSKHEDPLGYPGDGNDSYPLVRDLHAPSVPIPGPLSDDHNFNNVNDLQTPWKHGRGAKELIENLAWYCNTNYCQNPLIRGIAGTYAQFLEEGAKQWIIDAGLEDHYTIESVWNPDFSMLVEKLQNNSGIIINFHFYNSKVKLYPRFLAHYVAVAGINGNGSIAIADPVQNVANPDPSPSQHNDANVVSYDIYPVNFTSPLPEKASWWIEEYYQIGVMHFGGLAQYALIISETE